MALRRGSGINRALTIMRQSFVRVVHGTVGIRVAAAGAGRGGGRDLSRSGAAAGVGGDGP